MSSTRSDLGQSQPLAITDPDNPLVTRHWLERCYAAGLQAVDGRQRVRCALEDRPLTGPVWLIAIGKAASAMTMGALDHLGSRCLGGLIVDKAPPADPRPFAAFGIEWLTGGHPIPTGESLAAGELLFTALARTPPGATLLFLISGGASSLVEVPVAGLRLAELQQINRWLLGSGLPIGAMNQVRTAISRIKGGGLLTELPARPLRVLAISDVPGDDPAVIGSGLLVPAPDLASTVARLDLPPWLRAWVDAGLVQRDGQPGQGPAIELVATLEMATSAAAAAARALGLQVLVHPELLAGDAAERGRELARLVIECSPALHVWGGETTIQLPPQAGQGGRNQHLALAAARELCGHPGCLLLAAGTDGSDGPTEDAGALVDAWTVERAAIDGFDAADCLARADSGSLLAATGDLIHTGPTGTNVMDLVLGFKLRAPA